MVNMGKGLAIGTPGLGGSCTKTAGNPIFSKSEQGKGQFVDFKIFSEFLGGLMLPAVSGRGSARGVPEAANRKS